MTSKTWSLVGDYALAQYQRLRLWHVEVQQATIMPF